MKQNAGNYDNMSKNEQRNGVFVQLMSIIPAAHFQQRTNLSHRTLLLLFAHLPSSSSGPCRIWTVMG